MHVFILAIGVYEVESKITSSFSINSGSSSARKSVAHTSTIIIIIITTAMTAAGLLL